MQRQKLKKILVYIELHSSHFKMTSDPQWENCGKTEHNTTFILPGSLLNEIWTGKHMEFRTLPAV